MKKYKYTICLIGYDDHVSNIFEFNDYNDVQNLIDYMVDGATRLHLTIAKEEVKNDE